MDTGPPNPNAGRSPSGRQAPRVRYRDRHGRGLRGPLTPPPVPLSRTRAEHFDDVVLDAAHYLQLRSPADLDSVEFAVEDVPQVEAADTSAAGDMPVPLARAIPGGGGEPARIVVYRGPLQARATGESQLTAFVYSVLVSYVAELLGLDRESIDPAAGDSGGPV